MHANPFGLIRTCKPDGIFVGIFAHEKGFHSTKVILLRPCGEIYPESAYNPSKHHNVIPLTPARRRGYSNFLGHGTCNDAPRIGTSMQGFELGQG